MYKQIRELYLYREMLLNIVRRELRARYKGSILGFLWTFINPLMTLVIYTVVFSVIMRATVPKYSFGIYLFTGLLPWLFFSSSVQLSTSLIQSNSNLIKKIYFPRLILPVSLVATNMVNFLLSSLILVLALFIEKVQFSWSVAFVPILLIVLSMFTLGLSFLLSALTVFFRDIEHITSIFIMAWFYLTPIVYTSDLIPANLYRLFMINPLTPLLNAFQDCILYGKAPDVLGLAYASGFSLLLLTAGYLVFDGMQKRFAEEL
jgi:ABC-2 type transport system permease protein